MLPKYAPYESEIESVPVQKLRRAKRRRSTTRMLRRQLPGEEQRKAQRRDDGEGDDDRRAEPVQVLALVEHDLQRADPEHEQPQATPSMGVRRRADSRSR